MEGQLWEIKKLRLYVSQNYTQNMSGCSDGDYPTLELCLYCQAQEMSLELKITSFGAWTLPEVVMRYWVVKVHMVGTMGIMSQRLNQLQ